MYALWASQGKCRLVTLYAREGRHLQSTSALSMSHQNNLYCYYNKSVEQYVFLTIPFCFELYCMLHIFIQLKMEMGFQ